ncbi:hypothetical protein WA588_003271 [Blastocystis sp. NMH]
MIHSLFQVIIDGTKEHNNVSLFYPQICTDILSCLPDSFIQDICSNDDLMDTFFQIPLSGGIRTANCFCQITERFVVSASSALFPYLQLHASSVIDLLLSHIHLSSYLNALRYLLDIPTIDSACWWGDSSSFLSAVLDCLSDPLRSFNTKEFLLSIIQRATTCVPNELPKSSLYLLSALFTESSLDHITRILIESLQQTCELFSSYRDKTYALSDDGWMHHCVNGPAEICNNCFVVLARLFCRRSTGLWTGRGGYNTSFNSPVISVPELQEMGGVRKRSWIQLLAKRCLAVFNRVQSLMRSLTKHYSRIHRDGVLAAMVPKPFVGYYEFVYEFVHRQCEPSLLYHLIVDGFVDDMLAIMLAFPSVTYILISSVDILISFIYSNDKEVWTLFFSQTSILSFTYRVLSTPSLSPLKSQLCIFLQAIAAYSQCEVKTITSAIIIPESVEDAGEQASESSSDLLVLLESYPEFMKITQLIDIFHIFEPLISFS